MSKFWLSILGCVAGTVLAAEFFPGVHADELAVSALVGAGLGLVYQLLRPIVKVLAFPFALVTLGLLYVLIDAGLLWMVTTFFRGYTIDSFGWAIVTSVTVNLMRRLLMSMGKSR
ncbi:MAG: phage holin family protein [Clostridia bacterium]|nr:phage holin family protein [Clostridia bacterium]